MFRNIVPACLLVIAACNSKTKTDGNTGSINSVKDTVITNVKDSISGAAKTETGKPDLESLGMIKLGQHYSGVQEAMGPPDSKTKAIEWGADGLLHEDWTWKKNGLVLNMSSDKNNKDSTLSVFSITANSSCDLKTKADVGIGSSYAEVEAAYKDAIDPYSTNKDHITVGDLFGGIFFDFKKDKVVKVFLGAKAE